MIIVPERLIEIESEPWRFNSACSLKKQKTVLVCVLMFGAEYLSTARAYLIYSAAAAAAALDDISIFIPA